PALDARRKAHLGMPQLELAGLAIPVGIALAGHRLHVPVPLEIECFEAEPDRAAALFTNVVIGRVAAYRFDLPVAMPCVLLGVKLVRCRGTAGAAVGTGEVLEHARGCSVGSTVHRLNERKERDALERGAILAT